MCHARLLSVPLLHPPPTFARPSTRLLPSLGPEGIPAERLLPLQGSAGDLADAASYPASPAAKQLRKRLGWLPRGLLRFVKTGVHTPGSIAVVHELRWGASLCDQGWQTTTAFEAQGMCSTKGSRSATLYWSDQSRLASPNRSPAVAAPPCWWAMPLHPPAAGGAAAPA